LLIIYDIKVVKAILELRFYHRRFRTLRDCHHEPNCNYFTLQRFRVEYLMEFCESVVLNKNLFIPEKATSWHGKILHAMLLKMAMI